MTSSAALLKHKGAGADGGEEGRIWLVAGLFGLSEDLELSPVGDEEALKGFK